MWIPLNISEQVVDPQIPLEIGRIIMGWSRVENAFDSDIAWLVKNPKATAILPTDIPNAFKKRLVLWHQLVRAAYPDFPVLLKAAQEIRDVASLLAEWRNAAYYPSTADAIEPTSTPIRTETA